MVTKPKKEATVEPELEEEDEPEIEEPETEEDETTEEEDELTISEEIDKTLGIKKETSEPEEEEETPSKTDDIESFLPDGDIDDPLSGTDKRINKLTKRNYNQQAIIDKLEGRLEKLEGKEDIDDVEDISEAQILKAVKGALEDGDAGLLMQVINHSSKITAKKLRKEYEGKIKQTENAAQVRQQEMADIHDRFEYLRGDSAVEIYPGSSEELDVTNNQSKIFQLANYLFTDPEYSRRYQVQNGQTLAFSDAFKLILKKRKGQKVRTKTEKKLEKKLVREKRKTSLGPSTKVVKTEKEDDTPKKPRSQKEVTEDYILSRKKTKGKALANNG